MSKTTTEPNHCPRRTKRANRDERPTRYFVSFRKPDPNPTWVEVTVVGASRKQAVQAAKALVAPLSGLLYEGVD